MTINFSPRNIISKDEAHAIHAFIEALSQACSNTSCENCIFSKYCDSHPESPGDGIMEILEILGIDLN